MAAYPDGMIDQVLARRVCARCYGDLAKRPADNREWDAYCPACGDAWGDATISRHSAEMRGQQALAEMLEVKYNLADLFPNPNKGKSQDQILGELGY